MTSELINYVARYGGFCRDCADNDGVCDRGTPCDPKVFRAAIEHTIKALEYGIKHGFIENPFTRAVPDVPELVRYNVSALWGAVISSVGEYVLYSQAAEIIAAKGARIKELHDAGHESFKTAIGWQQRAETAEAEIAKYKDQIPLGYITPRDQLALLQEFSTSDSISPVKMGECRVAVYDKPAPAADLKAENDKLREALKRAEYGFDQIHQSLMGTAPKQASGEVTAFFLAETTAALNAVASPLAPEGGKA